MFRKKNLTPAQRIAAAQVQAGAAVSVFHTAATSLEEAAVEQRAAVEELDQQVADRYRAIEGLYGEIDGLNELALHAETQEANHLDAADRIRGLFA